MHACGHGFDIEKEAACRLPFFMQRRGRSDCGGAFAAHQARPSGFLTTDAAVVRGFVRHEHLREEVEALASVRDDAQVAQQLVVEVDLVKQTAARRAIKVDSMITTHQDFDEQVNGFCSVGGWASPNNDNDNDKKDTTAMATTGLCSLTERRAAGRVRHPVASPLLVLLHGPRHRHVARKGRERRKKRVGCATAAFTAAATTTATGGWLAAAAAAASLLKSASSHIHSA